MVLFPGVLHEMLGFAGATVTPQDAKVHTRVYMCIYAYSISDIVSGLSVRSIMIRLNQATPIVYVY